MKVLSLLKLAEDAGYIAEGKRNQLGAIQDSKTFEQNFAALDRQHRGVYAFVAFHPLADKDVVDYIADGSLGDDAGSHILALFLQADKVPQALREVRSSDPLFGISLSLEEHPAYALANKFFLGAARPQLPGIVFLNRLFEPVYSLYVMLEGANKEQIRAQCRKVFDAANQSADKSKGSGDARVWRLDFDRFAARLFELGVSYRRAGEKGVRSATFIAGAWLKKNASSIVVAIPKVVIPQLGKLEKKG
jgi:hypothetical protein